MNDKKTAVFGLHCDTSDEITRAKGVLGRTGADDISSAGEAAVPATSQTR